MTKEEINRLLDELKNGQMEELSVTKEDFLTFRSVLVNREDFKHFHGIAQRGGGVVYTYNQEERS
ncbi:MAG TPA: hypothetical protein VEY51_04230 [Chondromyces sp.]|nr:hypothetical protein [Chondromyces sp.]